MKRFHLMAAYALAAAILVKVNPSIATPPTKAVAPPVVIVPPLVAAPPGYHLDSNFDPKLDAEDRKHGAVLCSWSLMLGAQAVSMACHAGQDPAFDKRLSDAIRRTEVFIAKNGDARTAAMVKSAHSQLATFAKHPNPNYRSCDVGREQIYELWHRQEAKAFSRGIDELLRVPRPPVMNPCL